MQQTRYDMPAGQAYGLGLWALEPYGLYNCLRTLEPLGPSGLPNS